MTSSDEIPTVTFALPETPQQLHEMMQSAYHRGLDVADHTTPAERFESGYMAGLMDTIERIVECYGMSWQEYKHSNPEPADGFDQGPFHKAQASAYHTLALTIMLNEMEAEPETAILQFERLYYAISLRRVGTEDRVAFMYEPTGLCDGSPERVDHESDCGCGGAHGTDTLTVKPGTDILAHLHAAHDQLQAAYAPAMPDFDPSLN